MRYRKNYLFGRYYVEVGDNRKSKYQTKYVFNLNEENRAHIFYNAINCGNGTKKRLIKVEFYKVTVIRQFQSI